MILTTDGTECTDRFRGRNPAFHLRPSVMACSHAATSAGQNEITVIPQDALEWDEKGGRRRIPTKESEVRKPSRRRGITPVRRIRFVNASLRI